MKLVLVRACMKTVLVANAFLREIMATLTVRGIHFSSENCIQADIQRTPTLPHMNLNVSERLICSLRDLSRSTDHVPITKTKQLESENVELEERANVERMKENEPVSLSEAPQVPALVTEEGLSTPVAGPETPFRPTSGMPGLTLQSSTNNTLLHFLNIYP